MYHTYIWNVTQDGSHVDFKLEYCGRQVLGESMPVEVAMALRDRLIAMDLKPSGDPADVRRYRYSRNGEESLMDIVCGTDDTCPTSKEFYDWAFAGRLNATCKPANGKALQSK